MNKGAILVMNRKDECVKWFKTWTVGHNKARVEIGFKTKDGEKKKLLKKYEGWGGTVSLIKCLEAVMRYWPKFDPSKHNLVMSSGHNHSIKSKKVGKKNVRR